MYSNDTTQIEQGLINYIGALLKASPYDNKAARQDINAMLLKQSLNLAKDADTNHYDLYVLKPNLRAFKILIQDRINILSEAKENKDKINSAINKYKIIIEFIDNLLNNISE